MKLIVGLGNPGSQYEQTKHNAGFMAVDLFAQKHGAANYRVAHEGFMADVLLEGEKVLLLKPQTYMNLSGRAVASAMQFYKLTVESLLVVVDDVAIPCGTIRLRASGSSGGHNGLRDIEAAVSGFAAGEGKGRQDYGRLRIGVDMPPPPPVSISHKDWVLMPFTAEQRPKLKAALGQAVEAMGVWVRDGMVAAMNRFNGGEKGER